MSESDQSKKGPTEANSHPTVSGPSNHDKAEGARAAAQVDRKSGTKEHDYKLAATKGESDEATVANLHLGVATGLAMGALVAGGAAQAQEDDPVDRSQAGEGNEPQLEDGPAPAATAAAGSKAGTSENLTEVSGSSTLLQKSSDSGNAPIGEPASVAASGGASGTSASSTKAASQNSEARERAEEGVPASSPVVPTDPIDPAETNSAPEDIVVQMVGISELAPAGTVVATLDAVDPDGDDRHTFEIVDRSGSAISHPDFIIVGDEIRVRDGATLDFETTPSHSILVRVTDSAGNAFIEPITIQLTDANEDSVSAIIDADPGTDTISETALAGDNTGIAVSASDADATDMVSYSVDDTRFQVDANGVVTVAGGASFDAETEGTISLTVTATSTDGSTSNETFTVAVSDENEVAVSAVTDVNAATDTISETAGAGTSVGIQASAVDGDVTDTVSYSVNDARFEVDGNGVVTVASGASFDAETEGTISLTVTATSTDGSASNETFTVTVSDENEVSVSTVTDVDTSANTISEGATSGASAGIKVFAADGDVTDTVSYSMNDSRFEIDSNGVVTVASGASFDAETEGTISLTVTATSTDGSTSNETFTVAVGDENEVSVSAVTDVNAATNTISETAGAGASVGIQASAADGDVTDTVSYSVNDSRFEVDGNGVVAVVSGASFDAETEGTISLTVTATSTDGSTSDETFTVTVSDENEVSVSAVADVDTSANTISEGATAGASVGIQASAADGDVTDTVSYSVDDSRFEIDSNGVVTVAGGASFDAETEGTISLTVTATSTDGSTSDETFTVTVRDENEFSVSAVTDTDGSADAISEIASAGTGVGIKAFADDADISDTVSYSVNDARFEIDGNGVVTVANGASFDADTEGTISLTVTATSTDGSTSNKTVTVIVNDMNEVAVSNVTDIDNSLNTVSEAATAGSTIGIQAFADDGDVTDTVSYSVNDARFEIDGNGVVTVANGASFDAETEGTISLTVTATSTDGSTSNETFTVGVGDENEVSVSAVTDVDASADTISETAAAGTNVGIKASATDGDVTDTVSYSVNDSRFEIDGNGVVKVASGASFDAETEGTISLTVTATSTDGSTSNETFTVAVGDENEVSVSAVTDVDASANTITETAVAGTNVGIQASATDGDVTDTVSYSVNDSRFEIDSNGVVTVASGASFDTETEGTISLTVTATSTDGSTSNETFAINVSNINETPTSISFETDSMRENTAHEDILLTVADPDGDTTFTFSVDDSRFEVFDDNGEYTLRLKDGVTLNHETEATVDITVTATDAGGLSVNQDLTINVKDLNDNPVALTLSNSQISENASGATVGTLTVTDEDSTDTHSYTVSDSRFEVVDGALKLKDGVALDHETNSTVDVTVTVNDGQGGSYAETFTVNVADVNEGPTAVGVDLGATNEDLSVVITEAQLLAASSDPEGDTLSVTGLSVDASYGAVADNGDGTWTFTPTANFAGSDIPLSFTVSDGSMTDTATATIDITAVADMPIVSVGSHADKVILGQSETASSGFEGGNLDKSATSSSFVSTFGGWTTTSDAIELKEETLSDGSVNQFVELNDDAIDYYQDATNISRDFDTQSGHSYTISFEYAPRPGVAATVAEMEVLINGVVIETVSADGTLDTEPNWQTHTLTFQGDGSPATIEFRASGIAVDYGRGMFLDDVTIVESPPESTASGDENTLIDLPEISAGLTDLDGSETLSVVISAIPDGAVLSDGTNSFTATASTSQVDITDWQLDGLTILPPTDYDGNFDLTVTATSTDGSDTASSTDVLHVNVLNTASAPTDMTFSGNENLAVAKSAVSGTVSESIAADAVVASVASVVDQDGGDSFTYSVTDDAGGLFQIDGSTGDVSLVADHDASTSLSDTVTVQVTDSFDKTYSETVGIELGTDGADTLTGTSNTDVIYGFKGSDTLNGGGGDDTLTGGAGDDTLKGGLGDDILTGGDGADIFQYALGDGDDTVTGGGGSWIDTIQLGEAAGGTSVGVYGTDWTLTVDTGSVVSVDTANQTLTLSDDASGYIETSDGGRIDFSEIDQVQW